jgi:hypothetical protein
MELEQRHVIKFVTNEDMPGVKIMFRSRDHYGRDALSRMQIYFGSAK